MTDLGPCPLCGSSVDVSYEMLGSYIVCRCGFSWRYDNYDNTAYNRLSAMGELWRKKDAEKSLVDELIAALPDPTLLDMLAGWFDTEQHFRPHWKRTGVQNDLRKWAMAARAVLEKARKHNES